MFTVMRDNAHSHSAVLPYSPFYPTCEHTHIHTCTACLWGVQSQHKPVQRRHDDGTARAADESTGRRLPPVTERHIGNQNEQLHTHMHRKLCVSQKPRSGCDLLRMFKMVMWCSHSPTLHMRCWVNESSINPWSVNTSSGCDTSGLTSAAYSQPQHVC